MRLKEVFLVTSLLIGVDIIFADDDDDDDHYDDDDDGQPHYCPEENGMFPNMNDCSLYYNCVDGQAIPMACAPGLLFDKRKKMCNFPDQVKCKNECRGPNGLFPSQDRCDEFILCNNGKPEKKRCKKGLYFDPNLQVCNFKGLVLCVLPKSYKKSYKKKGKKSKKSKKYSRKDDDDDDEEEAKKRKGDDDEEDEDDDEEEEEEQKSKEKGTVQVGQYVGEGGNKANGLKLGHKALAAASVRSVCPKPRGLFAHPQFCDTFYQCFDGEVLIKKCPPGLLFDAFRHMCAFNSNVDCGSRTVPTKTNPT